MIGTKDNPDERDLILKRFRLETDKSDLLILIEEGAYVEETLFGDAADSAAAAR